MGKSKKSREYSSDSDNTSDSGEIEKKKKHKKKSKKHKKHKSKKKRHRSSSSASNSEPDAWIEKNSEEPKPASSPQQRDNWMSADDFFIPTYSKEKQNPKPAVEKFKHQEYDPATSSRELNPYFRTGEGGMPSFKRPKDDDDDYYTPSKSTTTSSISRNSASGNWRKKVNENEVKVKQRSKSPSRSRSRSRSRSPSPQQSRPILPARPEEHLKSSADHSDFLTDQQMNEIGAKMIKAELMGKTQLVEKLKEKLERAKAFKTAQPVAKKEKESVVLSVVTPAGTSRPIQEDNQKDRRRDDKRKKNKRAETHVDGERMQYYPDDGKYDIKQMFEREKFVDGKDQDIEFAKAFSKVKSHDQMDMADIFSDHIRKDKQKKTDERDEAIREHKKMEKILDSCNKCFDSPRMDKQLIVHVGKKVYLSIPYYEGLVNHHLVISPIQHISCSTMVDEDIWEEVLNLKKSLNQFFFKKKEDFICFEICKYLNRRPHMELHCISSPDLEMIEFYFKKAIQESEKGTLNKKLIEIKGDRNIRNSVPRGMSYFWVDFGSTGMAHVIEDQEAFPSNFAQEIIGGMLNLDVNRWRRPRKEQNPKRRVDYFSTMLKSILQ